jgi:hypothetical protein
MRSLFRPLYSILILIALCVFGSSSALSEEAAPQVYMLSTPIEQTTELPKALAGAWLVSDFGFAVFDAYIGYHLTGIPYTMLLTALNSLNLEVLTLYPKQRGLLMLLAEWKRRKDMQEIANVDGVRRIRVFSAGRAERKDPISATLRSKSIVFIETDKTPPGDFISNGWIPVHDLAETKIDLRLRINDEPVGSPIEIPLRSLFSGEPMDPTARAEWISKIDEWNHGFSFLERNVTQKMTAQRKSVEASLEIHGIEHPLGELGSGIAVDRLLAINPTARLIAWVKKLRNQEIEDAGKIFSKDMVVLNPETDEGKTFRDCVESRLYRGLGRALGTMIIRDP